VRLEQKSWDYLVSLGAYDGVSEYCNNARNRIAIQKIVATLIRLGVIS